MERRLALNEMKLGAKPGGTQMARGPLADDIVIQRAKRTVDKLPSEPFAVVMGLEAGYLQFVSIPFRLLWFR